MKAIPALIFKLKKIIVHSSKFIAKWQGMIGSEFNYPSLLSKDPFSFLCNNCVKLQRMLFLFVAYLKEIIAVFI